MLKTLSLFFTMLLASGGFALAASPDPLAVLGASQEFAFSISGKPLGTLSCRYSRAQGEGYAVESKLAFDYAALAPGGGKLAIESRLVVEKDGVPRSYRLTARVGDDVQYATCERVGQTWKSETFARGQAVKKEIELDPQAPLVVLDNNMIGHWALYLALAGLPSSTEPAARTVSAFVPQTLGVQRYQLSPLPPAPDGRPRLALAPVEEVFLCDPGGKLLRIEEPRQGLVISDVTIVERRP